MQLWCGLGILLWLVPCSSRPWLCQHSLSRVHYLEGLAVGQGALLAGAGGTHPAPTCCRFHTQPTTPLLLRPLLLLSSPFVAEVARWVEETQLPLTAGERQVLLEDLEEQRGQLPTPREAAAGLAAAAAAVAAGAGELLGVLGSGEQGSEEGDEVEQEEEEEEVDEGWSFSEQQQKGAASSAAASGRSAASKGRQQPAAAAASDPEIVPASSEDGEYDGDASSAAAAAAAAATASLAAGLGWLGRCQQQVVQAASAILGPLMGLPLQLAPTQLGTLKPQGSGLSHGGVIRVGAGGGGVSPAGPSDPHHAHAQPDQLQLLAGGLLGAVLLYAAVAERRAIRDGVGRAQRSVTGGMADLLRMAFSMSVNPMAVTPLR